ncbi:ACT domain-containing protein [Collinsella sp. zg1085]|uniref:ACT domain-containing protein n=1 Tax=Collinsella sp. zg1085 TaxID=2844380 RepID=UPI001C0C82F9|nr:ACT domain-containing protein [Collinsella sp. zg1085]QWT17957.1 ACT domain-containing protein [Collinsella sp. zg1085]
MAETSSHRVVITVLGKNRAGIVAAVANILGKANVDIRDISQSILDDIFTMTMIADMTDAHLDFADLQDELNHAGEAVGVTIHMQREDVFNFMYRL